MNQKTAQWLRSIKIHQSHINQVQLQNGYIFGLIFQKLNLLKDKKFKNTQDLACIFQNFKNTKDLLYDHFGIAFSANEILYRSAQLLQKVKQACEEYEKNKKQSKLGQIKKKYLPANTLNTATINEQKLLSLRQNEIKQQSSTLNNSLNANRTFNSNEPKMPQKILEIQKKLSKYRQQQTRHELLSLQTRKQQLETINQAIQDHRYFQMSKLRMTHEMKKEFEKKVADVVAKTEQKKQQRIQKDQQFFRFMKGKKDNFLQSLKQQDQLAFTKGLEDFQLNCLRQGIQLQHDPNKPFQPKQQNFNSQVMLERIKDNIKKLERQRKQRQKRTNSKYVQTTEANMKSQQVWQENYLIEKLEKSMTKQQKYVKETIARKLGQQATRDQIQLRLSKKTTKPLPEATQQQKQDYEAEVRANRLVFYDKEIERLQKKEKNLKAIAEQTLQALLYATIVAEESQTNLNFTYSEWKDLQKVFINYEVTADDKRKKDKSELASIKQPKQQEAFLKYLQELILVELSSKGHISNEQKEFAELIDGLIEQAYPKKAQSPHSDLSLYMPLRIGFSGNRLSGKTTQIKKLLSKYQSLVLIDPKKILTEALQLARPPPQNQDPKKKKDSKKPEEETPQRIQLKKFGQSILAELKADSGQQTEPVFDYETASFKYVIKTIKWKLQQSFKNLSPEQIVAKFNQCEEQEKQRIKDFQKNQQEKNKKKDTKKGAPTEVVQQSPVFNDYFYTEGFILDNVQLTEQNLRDIERQLNGFVKMEERLNDDAQRLRQQLGQILPIQKSQISSNLNKGFFNILINLDAHTQVQQKRNEGRKMDPQTGQVYHPVFNPAPTDVKGLAERLVQVKKLDLQAQSEWIQKKQRRQQFYKVFGYDEQKLQAYYDVSELPLEDIPSEIVRKVERFLGMEYSLIKNSEITQKKEKNMQKIVQNNQSEIVAEIQNLNPLVSTTLLKRQSQLKQSYADSISEQLSQLPSIRFEFEQSLLQHQRGFLQIITRPDDKANRILTFQDNFNKLLEEKANIINDKSAIAHLVSKLDELYDSLWVNIEEKKNQAIQKRKSLIASSWLNSEVQKIVQKGKAILQAQLNYLVDILSFIIVVQLHLQNKQNDPVVDYFCLGVPKQNEPIQSIISPTSQTKVSLRLQFYLNQVESCLQSLPQWYTKKQIQSKTKLSPKLKQLADNLIQKQKHKISYIISYTKEIIYSYSQEEMSYFSALVNKMDDWIICGIKDENEFTYAIYKNLKSSIQRITKSQLKDLFPVPITAAIRPIDKMTHFHQPLPLTNNLSDSFDYISFKIFLEELKCLAFSPNSSQSADTLKISFPRFQEYFNKRKNSKLLANIYLRLDFDSMQQFLVTENQANFKEVALAMLLWNVNVLDEEGLASYASQLSGPSDNQLLTLSQPSQLSVSSLLLSQFNPSREQITSLQHLIFDIMQNEYTQQVSIKEYIELLGSFNSLQLFKYGDSLM